MNFKESPEFLSAIIASAIDAIIIIDAYGVIQVVNKAANELFDYTMDDLVGKNVAMLMPPEHSHRHDGYISNYLNTGDAKIIGIGREVPGMRKDGTRFPLRLAVSEVKLEDAHFFVGFLQDLTQIKEAEASVLKLNEELEEKVALRTEELSNAVNTLLEINKKLEKEIRDRQAVEKELLAYREELEVSLAKEKELSELKSRFVSMASHEFRTPLSTILSSAALIGRYKEEEQQDKRDRHLARIKGAVNALNSILNDFLSISKIEEGKIAVTMSDVPFVPLCHDVIEDISGLLKKGQSIELVESLGGLVIETDKNVLKNIMFNLLSNAIKYSGENTLITLSGTSKDDNLVINITDRGMGIPQHDQKHLFTRFFRASNVTNIQGTGLGLNIVAGYVKMLKGAIDFKSEPDKGTTFTVTIPISNTQDGEDPHN